MKAIIEKYNFDCIWHFTDRSNLESIKNHGLLSFVEAGRRGIHIPVPGGNDWSHDADKHKGVEEYIHLAFIDDHPMVYTASEIEKRILDPVWLKIDPSILLGEGVRFTLDVSNKKDVPVLTAGEAKEQIDWEVLFTYMDWDNPAIQARRQAAVKSEILVPDFIPVEKILDC